MSSTGIVANEDIFARFNLQKIFDKNNKNKINIIIMIIIVIIMKKLDMPGNSE